ncbi:MAG: RHS repeat domain-containing protein, partial [Burkholderiales bacterium]
MAGSSALFEEDRLGAGTQTEPFRYRYKHSINTPEGTVSIVVIDAQGGANPTTTRSDRTFHRDHLGSTVAVTDENGTEFLGYDAWGKRRNANGQDNNIAAWVGLSSKTDRGYTGHEHIDDIGLIHMNGRLYDPITGRMMSADPIIQAPYLLQNYNRYSYVMNNPLSLTDPSGFSWWTRNRRAILGIAVAAFIGGFDFSAFLSNGSFSWSLGANGIGGAIAGGFAAGGTMGGNMESAINGAFSAAMFAMAGDLSGAMGLAEGSVGKVIIHASVGCFGASMAGGDCGAGAASAGFAQLVSPYVTAMSQGNQAMAIMAHGVAGGLGARIAGGGFADGMTTGAFGYLFNCGLHPGSCMRKSSDPDPNWHQAENTTVVCHISTPGCTRDAVFERGVRHCPTPGACFDAPVVSGQVAGIKDPTGRVNYVRFFVDESNYAVFNITVAGGHMWDPGYVYRNVQQDSRGYVSIGRYGEGWGAGRAANL